MAAGECASYATIASGAKRRGTRASRGASAVSIQNHTSTPKSYSELEGYWFLVHACLKKKHQQFALLEQK
jgi:hypothetical protein